ncbi:DNA repair protein RecO [Corynebacterium choanae]|uniref:DNA repair protein RecO n=1 Tax=Corynebacterium choanae TaxID=1862358 RepID=A0A3G6J829_9CORY|nr:DNA repair protein RecO [Corynebacterium choanae]AZA14059.1 DNA repair protein RecO [Corynebacterium choanae]
MPSREHYKDEAFVVRTHDFGEADRIVVLLTRDHGLVRAVAKGVRRTKSRFGSRIQRFVQLSMLLYPGRNLALIAEADTIAYFGAGIIEDYNRYTAGCAALDCAAAVVGVAEGEAEIFDEVAQFFQYLQHAADPVLLLDALLLRLMRHAGWAPSLFDCANCGDPGPHCAFAPAAGGAVCSQCRPVGSMKPAPAVLRLMWHMANRDLATIAPTASQLGEVFPGGSTALCAEAHRLTRAHLQYHLERNFVSLAMLSED